MMWWCNITVYSMLILTSKLVTIIAKPNDLKYDICRLTQLTSNSLQERNHTTDIFYLNASQLHTLTKHS